MTVALAAAGLEQLAELARLEAERHPARSPERRAAAHLWVALTVPPASSAGLAVKAIAGFGAERTQAAAVELLHRLAVTTTSTPEENPA